VEEGKKDGVSNMSFAQSAPRAAAAVEVEEGAVDATGGAAGAPCPGAVDEGTSEGPSRAVRFRPRAVPSSEENDALPAPPARSFSTASIAASYEAMWSCSVRGGAPEATVGAGLAFVTGTHIASGLKLAVGFTAAWTDADMKACLCRSL
jgi:hypothetical protein